MGLYTLTPNGDVQSANNNLTGAATRWQALDSSDSSWVQMFFGGGPSIALVDLTNPSIPGTEAITQVRACVRYDTNNGSTTFYAILENPLGQQCAADYYTANKSGNLSTEIGGWRTTAPDGGAWTLAKVNDLRLRLQDNLGGGSAPRITYAYVEVQTSAAPVAAVTAPTGTLTTNSTPTISGTYSDTENDAMDMVEVKVFTQGQYSAGGFNPDTSTPTWTSGTVSATGSTWSVAMSSALANKTTFRAYARVRNAVNGGHWSAWVYQQFTVAINLPAPPFIDSSAPAGIPRVTLTPFGFDNHMGEQDASFESSVAGTGSWAGVSGVTSLARSTAQAFDGSACMAITCAGSVDAVFQCGYIYVAGGVMYGAGLRFRSNTVTRIPSVYIAWYTSTGTYISASATGTVRSTTSSWTLLGIQGIAPANAHFARIVVGISGGPPASGEIHYIDAIQFTPRALNVVENPTLAADSNNDGTPDSWSTYNWVGSGTDPTPTLLWDTADPFAGTRSFTMRIVENDGWKGVYQLLPLMPAFVYSITVWVKVTTTMDLDALATSSREINLYFDQATVATNTASRVLTNADRGKWIAVTLNASVLTGSYAVGGQLNTNLYIRTNLRHPSQAYSFDLAVGAVQVERWDSASQWLNLGGPYTRPAILTPQRFEVQRSSDNGATWTTLTRESPHVLATTDASDAFQAITTDDYEAPRGVALKYRARVKTDLGGGVVLYSDWGQWRSQPALTASGWWLKSTTAPSTSMAVSFLWDTFSVDRPIDVGEFDPIDADETVVVQGRTRGQRLTGTLRFTTETEWAAFNALRERKDTLLLQDSNARQWYVRLVGKRPGKEKRWKAGSIERRVPFEAVEVAA